MGMMSCIYREIKRCADQFCVKAIKTEQSIRRRRRDVTVHHEERVEVVHEAKCPTGDSGVET